MTAPPRRPFARDEELPTQDRQVHRARDGAVSLQPDRIAVEEPLEIRLGDLDSSMRLSITMRTPGHDFELVAGFLLAEGVIDSRDALLDIAYCLGDSDIEEQRFNAVRAVLDGPPGVASVERLVVASSACGIWGTASIAAAQLAGHPAMPPGPVVPFELLRTFPDRLRDRQRSFGETGGVHGIALLDTEGTVLCAREDVGRHNAVDKVVGWALLEGLLPLSATVLMVSGRISFEIVHKALRAGIPIVAAVSAATSLAIELADETDMTLVGFLRGSNCTIYCGSERVSFD